MEQSCQSGNVEKELQSDINWKDVLPLTLKKWQVKYLQITWQYLHYPKLHKDAEETEKVSGKKNLFEYTGP